MATTEEIRAGLAANLASIVNLQESPYVLSNPTPPSAEVVPGPTDYDKTAQRGMDWRTMKVRVFVGLTTDVGAQKRLDPMLDKSGASSVKERIESDETLGGVVDNLRVTRCSGYMVFERGQGQAPVLGAEWNVQVLD